MEARDVLLCDLAKRLDLKLVGEGLLDSHLVLAGELHEEDVHDVEDEEDESLPNFYSVPVEEDRDDDQVHEDENGFTRDDPPVNQRLCRHD